MSKLISNTDSAESLLYQQMWGNQKNVHQVPCGIFTKFGGGTVPINIKVMSNGLATPSKGRTRKATSIYWFLLIPVYLPHQAKTKAI